MTASAIRPAKPSAARRMAEAAAGWARLPIWASLSIGLVAVVAFPLLFGDAYTMRVATLAGLAVVLALSLTLLMGGSGEMSFAHGAFYGIGAYAIAILTTRSGFTFWSALPVAVLLGAVAGALVGVPSLRTRGLTFAIVTLGFGLIAFDVLEGWTSLTAGSVGIPGILAAPLDAVPALGPPSLEIAIRGYYLIWVAALLVVGLVLWVFRSDFGGVLRGIRGDPGLVESLGFRPGAFRLTAFVLSAAIAAFAGALFAQYVGYVSPQSFTFLVAFSAVVIVAVGGVGNPWGTVITGAALTALPEVLRFLSDYRLMVYAVLLFAVLLVRSRLGWRT